MPIQGFPCGSAGEESACNVGDVGLIPGLGRSLEEGKGYPLQYSGLEKSVEKSLGSQRVGHNSAAFTFTFLKKEMATHSNILAWEIPWTEKPGGLQSVGSKELTRTQQLSH